MIRFLVAVILGAFFVVPSFAQTAKTPANLLLEERTCAAQGLPAGCITPNSLGDIVQTFVGRTSVSVTEYGAKCDGVTNDTSAFAAAIAAVPAGGTVYVPVSAGVPAGAGNNGAILLGLGCLVNNDSTIFIRQQHLVGLGQGAAIKCNMVLAGNNCIQITDTGINSLNNPMTSIEHMTLYYPGASCNTCDLLLVDSGNHMLVRDVLISGAGRDGLAVWSYFNNGWVESLHIDNVRVVGSRRDNYHFEVDDGCTNCFITQTTVVNSASRLPGRYALELSSLNNQHGNYKISVFDWIGGELSCSSSIAPSVADCVHITQASNDAGQAVESISFIGTTIEDDVFAAHTGFAIGVTKTGSAAVGPVNFSGIYFGEASGALDTTNLGAWMVDACADGVTQWCHGQDTLQIQKEAGLSFAGLSTHTGANTQTLTNSPCAAGNPQTWIAIPIGGVTHYVAACHP